MTILHELLCMVLLDKMSTSHVLVAAALFVTWQDSTFLQTFLLALNEHYATS